MRAQMTVIGPVSVGTEVLVLDPKGEKIGTVLSATPEANGTTTLLVEIDADSEMAKAISNPPPLCTSMGVTSGEKSE